MCGELRDEIAVRVTDNLDIKYWDAQTFTGDKFRYATMQNHRRSEPRKEYCDFLLVISKRRIIYEVSLPCVESVLLNEPSQYAPYYANEPLFIPSDAVQLTRHY